MAPRPSFIAVVTYFLRLGLTGFGGPVALASYMRRDLVDEYRWLGADEYDEGLAIATACPGPLAYQLGVYCGYVMHGVPGALSVAVAFSAAPFSIVVAVAALYVRFGSSWVLQGIFYGVGPIVIALIIRSCWDLGKKTLRHEWLAYTFACVACAITIVIQQELTILFLTAGALGIVLFYKPAPTGTPKTTTSKSGNTGLFAVVPLPIAYQAVPLPNLFLFFFKTGFLVFGSGLVVVPFLKAYVVEPISLAFESGVLGCGGGRNRVAWSGRHHGNIRRVPDAWFERRDCRDCGDVCSVIDLRAHWHSDSPQISAQCAAPGLHPGNYRRGGWRPRRDLISGRKKLDTRLVNPCTVGGSSYRHLVEVEGPRTESHWRRRTRRADRPLSRPGSLNAKK